jgi:chemotaxis protein MotB
MRTYLKLSAIIAFVVFISTSCASTQKLANANKERDNYKNQAETLESKNGRLMKQNDSLNKQIALIQSKLTDQLQQKQKDLNQSNQELDDSRTIISNLQKTVGVEKNEVNGIRQKICNALKCFTPDELSIKVKDGELYVSMYDKLLFPTGSAVVNNRGKKALNMLAEVLTQDNMEIMVEGHTDAVPINNGKFFDNWDLSVMRATSVTRLLVKDKIPPERIIASGRGKYHPYDSNKNEKGRRLNRRTDIVIVPKLDQLYSLINQDNKQQLSTLGVK